MKMITQMKESEMAAFRKIYDGMNNADKELVVKFGGDMYFNGYVRGIAAGAGAAIFGMLIGCAVDFAIDQIKFNKQKKELEKSLEDFEDFVK